MLCVISTTTSRAYSPSVLTIVTMTGTTTITMSHPVMRTHQRAMRIVTMLLNSNLSSPSSTSDDSGSDPTPGDERHHLSAALTSKLKKHKSSRNREATMTRKPSHPHHKKSKCSHHYEDTSTDSSSYSDSDCSSIDTSSTDSHCHGKSHKRDRRISKHIHSTVPISRLLGRKIVHNEFLDFSKLLTSHLVAKGTMHKGCKASANPIASLYTWLQAWSLFTSQHIDQL